MDTLYEKNGLFFWTEKQIQIRQMLANYFVDRMKEVLRDQNKAFEFFQCEAPILTPIELINPNYTPSDYYSTANQLALRPETTTGSYHFAKHLLSHPESKAQMPICVWQHGKSFRLEQDHPRKYMRLKEFYQLEFQCIYGLSTGNDYSIAVIPAVNSMISDMIGESYTIESDRLPSYSEKTIDVVCSENDMEICSISIRNDYPGAKVLEVAIGTDRCVFNFLNKMATLRQPKSATP